MINTSSAPAGRRAASSRTKGRVVVRVGRAGWSLPGAVIADFPADGSHLQRYAGRLSCVEINSSFYRPYRAATYERWAQSVPDDFRFSVKLPRAITHDGQLRNAGAQLDDFLAQVR